MAEEEHSASAAELLAAYAWAETGDPVVEALSITLVQPDDEQAVVGHLSPRSEWPGRLTVAEALDATLEIEDFAWGAVLAQTDSLAGWGVVIEPNGWAASLPDALERLSRGGVAVNVFWNVNAVVSFALARGGTVMRQFDGVLYNDPGKPLPQEDGLPWGAEAPRASALAVMERVTGVRLDRDWMFGRARPTFVVPL